MTMGSTPRSLTPQPRTRAAGPAFLATLWVCGLLAGPAAPPAAAELREVELVVDWQEIDLTGEPVRAMTVNGGLPGPTLRFTEGDTARIHVHNRMDVETSIHWHGLLVPPGMDGVPNLSFPPIAPGDTFTYEFPIRQSGTYWYHSHTHLQEQRGVYGSIVIGPRGGEADPSDRDHVVLLSDWTDTHPDDVLRLLRRGSEWYAIERGTGQSLLGAARVDRLGDFLSRELLRMPPMDISDVAYDLFLANGQAESKLPAAAGDRVRLRLIDGSASTFFHVEFAGGPMTVVAADGLEVEPFTVQRLLIGVAETYDVLVDVPPDGAFELRATSHDATGYASVWLGDGERHPAATVPYPDLYRGMGGLSAERVFALTPAGSMGMTDRLVDSGAFDAPGMHMAGHGGMGEGAMDAGDMQHGDMQHGDMQHDSMQHGATDHGDMQHGAMDHGDMQHGAMASEPPAEAATTGGPGDDRGGKGFGGVFSWLATDLASRGRTAADGMDAERPFAPYARLRARRSTAFDPDKPVREVRLTLDGDMERYVWFLDGVALSESDDIEIRRGEIVRFIMINRTMMHHPMHLHGHFFRVVNGQGDHAPLKHTVDVEPMSTTVIEFDADELGDWFFHCHLLYHMKSGMARVVSYRDYVPSPEVQAVRPALYEEHWYRWGEADLMSHATFGTLVTASTRNIVTAEWEIGWADVEDTEGEVTVTWDRYVDRFTSFFLGVDVEGDEDDIEDPRGVLGVRYLLPFNLESMLWVDSDGEIRAGLERHLELTPRLGLELEVEYDSLEDWEGSARLAYTVDQRLDLLAHWHSEYGAGAGLALRF